MVTTLLLFFRQKRETHTYKVTIMHLFLISWTYITYVQLLNHFVSWRLNMYHLDFHLVPVSTALRLMYFLSISSYPSMTS